jgi:hypothetical protein
MIPGAFQTSVSEGEPDKPSRGLYVADVPIADISNTHAFKHVTGYENQIANAS